MSGIVKKIGAFAAQRAAATTECACNRSGWEFVAKKSECLPGKVSRVDSNKGQERKEKKKRKKSSKQRREQCDGQPLVSQRRRRRLNRSWQWASARAEAGEVLTRVKTGEVTMGELKMYGAYLLAGGLVFYVGEAVGRGSVVGYKGTSILHLPFFFFVTFSRRINLFKPCQ